MLARTELFDLSSKHCLNSPANTILTANVHAHTWAGMLLATYATQPALTDQYSLL